MTSAADGMTGSLYLASLSVSEIDEHQIALEAEALTLRTQLSRIDRALEQLAKRRHEKVYGKKGLNAA